MTSYKGRTNTMMVETTGFARGDEKELRFAIDGGQIDWRAVVLLPEQIRALRDQINAHLGEESKPLPVGTIVVGKGLTEAQKKNPPNVEYLSGLRYALSRLIWGEAEEGRVFWDTLYRRVDDMERAVREEKSRQEEEAKKPKSTDAGAYKVETSASTVVMRKYYAQGDFMSPKEARDLAAALVKHAEAAEKKP